jgi:hypothetical protein
MMRSGWRAALLALLTCLFMAGTAGAQEVLLSGDRDYGGYGRWQAGAGSLLEGGSALMGVGGYLLLDGVLGIGVANLQSVSDRTHRWNGRNYDVTARMSGLDLEVHLLPSRVLHGSVALLIAGGELEARRQEDSYIVSDGFFALRPHGTLELNVIQYLRIGATVGYRQAWAVEQLGLTEADLGGLDAMLTLKIGHF